MTITKVTQTYHNNTVECARIVADKVSVWRFYNTLDTGGDFVWQFVIKADANKSIGVVIGDKSQQFNVNTAFQELVGVYEDVTVTQYPYVEIVFPVGTYYITHTQLEHGNQKTDWKMAPEDTEEKFGDYYTIEQTNSIVQQLSDSITSEVSKTYITIDNASKQFDETYNTIRTLETQTADKFSWLIESGNSSTNFTLTDRTADLVAQYFNISGNVQLNGSILIENSVTADKIKTNNLEALSANIGGYEIANGNLVCDTSNVDEFPEIYLRKYIYATPYTYGECHYTYQGVEQLQYGYIYGENPNMYYPISRTTKRYPEYDEITYKIYNRITGSPSSIPWSAYMDSNIKSEYTTRKQIDANGDYRVASDKGVVITGQEKIVIAKTYEKWIDSEAPTINIPEIDLYADSVKINDYSVWNTGNAIVGKITGISVTGNATTASAISIPISKIGSENPVVIATTNNFNCYTYISGISTSETNKIITIGVKNTSSTTVSNVAVHYTIFKYGE